MIPNIHGHSILRPKRLNQRTWEYQVSWVKGYILALEDVIKDIDTLDALQEGNGPEFYGALAMTHRRVTETLGQANATLEYLHQMKDEHQQDWIKGEVDHG